MASAQRNKGFQVAARLTPVEYKMVEQLVANGLYRSAADFARESIREKLRGLEPTGVQEVSAGKAERMIVNFLKHHPGPNFASEMAEALGLDCGVTFRAINKLLESRKIRKSRV
jgi:hypothetical protein